ncbi:hypothetical protein ATE68_15720 [Sphingopyxis sp. H038]|jgi:glycine/D-amino acid oxidase-like deaminating enzyme|uniref:NAD(P)/FAD-dependent oxidoreductase n=1 Tax=unclassified Sphingopyxis TaxID=2614943 RepID=UPI00073182A6|nr:MULTISPECIES: FAD-dependent oxidoreductase [unclassified Sphingopyxis]KTE00742.1 hypothetical protein ATE78_17480 [Sphingopyxis sp. H012]KTE11688.1 hypothetical protein ATE70_06385 [Sphingopyxis sp. H053]KTE16408.1 hypothetical protein ATE76_01675 [Sphingopyxis sp. H093]KTE28531.1 hypothetical protein ATE75_11560 [Sphingopyxis sp. H080]KTE33394.1 hypothetical protein ATE68_15720 [Sphingopyxis sp. H038]
MAAVSEVSTACRPGRRTSPPHAGKSFWIRDFGDYSPNRDLDTDLQCDILVIGGGIAGLSSAWHAAKSGLGKVVLIESEIIGFGASGRAAGWIMPQFGMDQLSIRKTYGVERSRAAFAYCRRATAYTREIIEQNGIESDYRAPGLMRVAFDDRWVDDLHDLYSTYEDIGVDTVSWLTAPDVQAHYNGNTNFKAAIFDTDLGLLNPCKQVRALKGLAEAAGVTVYENTPATHIERRPGGVRVMTPGGSIGASKVVIATNAFTHQLQGPVGRELAPYQAPVFARGAVTERLSDKLWAEIGWKQGNAIESSLDLFHYMAPTADHRIQFYFIYYGGHPVRNEMEPAVSAKGGDVSLAHLKRIFPALGGVRLEHNWGGHMSATRDMVPHLTSIGDQRVIYIGGCWGHGLAINHLHGQTVADMLAERSTDLTDFWIVDRKPKNWPVWPLDFIGKQLAWSILKRKVRKQIRGSIFEGFDGDLQE